MTANSPISIPAPRRRWRQSRKLRYAVLLLAVGFGLYLLLPWIFMPADLRRMQGTWKFVQILGDGKDDPVPEHTSIIISGNHLALRDNPDDATKVTENYGIELRADVRELRLHVPQEIDVLGIKFNAPIWLWHSKEFILLNYELDEPRLLLRLQVGDGKSRDIFLQRQ